MAEPLPLHLHQQLVETVRIFAVYGVEEAPQERVVTRQTLRYERELADLIDGDVFRLDRLPAEIGSLTESSVRVPSAICPRSARSSQSVNRHAEILLSHIGGTLSG